MAVVDWSTWRTRQWGVLQSHCIISEANFDASTRLVDVIASDLVQISELFKGATKMRSLLNQLKQWEKEGSREPEQPQTLLTDAISAHPLSDRLFGDASSIVSLVSLPASCSQIPTPPQTSESESPPRPSSPYTAPPTSSLKSNKSNRSKNSSGKNSSHSTSSYITAGEYQRDQTHHPRRGPSPSHSQGTRNTSRSSGTASSGGTATQSAADGEVADAIERAAEEKVRRRAMAVRALKEGHRLRNIYDKKRKEVAELDKTEERLRGNGSATSAGSARSRCSGSRHDNASTPTAGDWNARSKTTINPAHEGRSPADVVAGELDDAYAEAWAQYLSEWDGILRQPTPSPYRTFQTIPWPTLHKPTELKDLSKYAIKTFFKFASHHGLSPRTPRIRRSVAVATNTVEETRNLIQVIQDGQMIWHPDRWNDWMKHVAQGEHEAVKKGADVVIRVLHRMSEQRKDKRAGSDGEA
ncbi:hypothetical protein FRB96_003798 [Tulasnella sp. 330]|nr:hypothetical protein FRB96_003798 [Tulasnella sp. 330]